MRAPRAPGGGRARAGASLLEPSQELLRRRELFVVVERALEHLHGLLVVALPVADLAEVVEDLGLRDGRVTVELLEQQRLEGLRGALDVHFLRLVVGGARRELERQNAELAEHGDRAG